MTKASLFHEALARPAAERAAFLDEACAGQPELRASVESLLALHEAAGSFLDRPAIELEQAVAPALGETDFPVVPGYHVQREIARGGMGRVLAAFDLGLERDVALKVLLPGANADRFVRESKITARLPHPGIPPVHELGTLADGSPFLAMKLIAGQTLAEEMKTADRPRLLQVFVQVCQAVGFAHSRGIIHRDLKPANIMVGAFGEVQVMDWGLAKELTGRDASVEPRQPTAPTAPAVSPAGTDAEQTTDQRTDAEQTTEHRGAGESTEDQTQEGAILGTPAYMAPEVAVGQAATRAADVYGLGAILYTLLTGRPPYTGRTVAEVLQKVTTTEPDLFVEANSSVPPALVAICGKAMARNPDARYPAAEDVASDVRLWLSGEPVSVYREPWTDRVVRWARRRKTTVVAATVLLLTTAIAATVAAGLVWREQRQTKFEQQQTRIQWERAEGEKVKATENADAAITVVHDLSRYVREVELVQLAGDHQMTHQQRKLMYDKALPGYERLLALHPDDEELRSTAALLHRIRANLCRNLGESSEAEKSYRVASRHYGELASTKPKESTHQFDLAVTARDFALLLKTLGRLKESAEFLEGPIRRMEEYCRVAPDDPKTKATFAMMLLDRAELDYVLGRFAETERHARRSIELFAQVADRTGDNPNTLGALFRGMGEIRLAIALRELGRFDDALAVHDRVIERFAGILKLQTDRPYLYRLEYHRAQAERAWTLAQMSNRRALGLADLDSAIVGFERLAKQFPQLPSYPRSQGMATLYRGRLKALLGQREAAAKDLNAAARIFESLVGKYKDVPVYRSYLGQTYMALGVLETDLKTSAQWYRKAREMLDAAVRRSPENALDRKRLASLDALTKGPKP
jgi:serine/threonine protein kinase/tetratricopeptide (TPR) repeat protein